MAYQSERGTLTLSVIPNDIEHKLEHLPDTPGVYLFMGEQKSALYVGKARNLRTRVRSYFQEGTSDMRAFITKLEKELVDIQTFVTDTEKEAALLENELIKTRKPKYNIKLRDDKDFLSLRLDMTKTWPRLEVVRRPKADGATYFGPYPSATSARKTLRTINRYFQLRTCTDSEFRNRTRPCLQYQIKRCPAPCVLEVKSEHYHQQVTNVARFLSGRHVTLRKELEAQMTEASAAQRYEQAALYRDQLKALDNVREDQRIASVSNRDQDVLGLYRDADRIELSLLIVREGRIANVNTFSLRRTTVPNDEIISAFIGKHYQEGRELPHEIIVPMEMEAKHGLEALLSANQHKLEILAPQRGTRRKLLDIANQNAKHAFSEKQRFYESSEQQLLELKEILRLDEIPREIECVDISHLQGQQTVAVFAALSEAVVNSSRYRSFHVKNAAQADDYSALYEVILRRLRRGREGDEGWELPDLLVVDGGKGQLRAAQQARNDLNMKVPNLASIAKRAELSDGSEVYDRVFRPEQKDSIPISKHPALMILARARDEAHRASNQFRKKTKKYQSVESELDAIPGIGPRSRKHLLSAFGSIKGVKKATVKELRRAGLNKVQIKALQNAFSQTVESSRSSSSESEIEAEESAIDNAFLDSSLSANKV